MHFERSKLSNSNYYQLMKYLSLFSGIGGFELGMLNAHVEATHRKKNRGGEEAQKTRGGKRYSESESSGPKGRRTRQHDHLGGSRQEPLTCVGYSEIDKYAVEIYQKRFPQHKNYGDITKIKPHKLPNFDLLVGGFPCQAFSIAGKRKGFEDTRGTLFFDIARILRSKKPRLFVLENVKGLLSHDSGNTFKTIIATLAKLGYDIQWQVLNSKNFGVPQNRERVFIVGHLRGTARPKVFPFTENNSENIVLPTITTRVTADSNGTYVGKRPKNQELKYVGAVMTKKNQQWIKDGKALSRNFPQGQRVYSADGISATLASQAGGLGAKTGLYAIGGLQKHQTPRKDGISPTLTRAMGMGGGQTPIVFIPEATKKGYAEAKPGQAINLAVPNSKTRRGRVSDVAQTLDTGMQQHTLTTDMKIRRLTPMECERLQGFPDGWTEGISDSQRYKTLGNAVTVNVVEVIIRKIISSL